MEETPNQEPVSDIKANSNLEDKKSKLKTSFGIDFPYFLVLFDWFSEYCANMIKAGSANEFTVIIAFYFNYFDFIKNAEINPEDKDRALKLSKIVLTAWNGTEELSSDVLKEALKIDFEIIDQILVYEVDQR